MAYAEVLPAQPVYVPRWDMMGVSVLAGRGGEVIRELDGRLATGEAIKLAYLNAHASNVAARQPRISGRAERVYGS